MSVVPQREQKEDDMRLKTPAAIVLFVVLTLTCGTHAQQSGRSVTPSRRME
jgi:hypothetical protein